MRGGGTASQTYEPAVSYRQALKRRGGHPSRMTAPFGAQFAVWRQYGMPRRVAVWTGGAEEGHPDEQRAAEQHDPLRARALPPDEGKDGGPRAVRTSPAQKPADCRQRAAVSCMTALPEAQRQGTMSSTTSSRHSTSRCGPTPAAPKLIPSASRGQDKEQQGEAVADGGHGDGRIGEACTTSAARPARAASRAGSACPGRRTANRSRSTKSPKTSPSRLSQGRVAEAVQRRCGPQGIAEVEEGGHQPGQGGRKGREPEPAREGPRRRNRFPGAHKGKPDAELRQYRKENKREFVFMGSPSEQRGIRGRMNRCGRVEPGHGRITGRYCTALSSWKVFRSTRVSARWGRPARRRQQAGVQPFVAEAAFLGVLLGLVEARRAIGQERMQLVQPMQVS